MSATIPFHAAPPPGATREGKGTPREWYTLYDWALVWRYWHGLAQGLRRPYPLEQMELLRLGRHLTQAQLAERLGLPERTICRWRGALVLD